MVALGASPSWSRTWRECQVQEAAWYETEEAIRIADNVLYYQSGIGGWYKNDASVHPSGHAATEDLTEEQRKAHREALRKRTFPCTLDNGATHTEMRYLAAVHGATGEARFREGFAKGRPLPAEGAVSKWGVGPVLPSQAGLLQPYHL